MKAICGLECTECVMKENCPGCTETGGRPFGGSCVIGLCCERGGCENCGRAFEAPCRLKAQVAAEFNALGIPGMEEVKDMGVLPGGAVNLEYTLPGGQRVKFWDEGRSYLVNQLQKQGSERCYGLTADEEHLLVCEYGENGSDPEIIVYQKRK